jgi:diacylglycerol kinase (ATP)
MSYQSSVSEPLVNPHKKTGFRRVVHAMRYSIEGVCSALKHESAFRQEMVLAVVMVPFAVIAPVSLVAKVLLIGSVFAVLVVELLNSAIEWIVDYISLDMHPMAKRAKDMASGAVFLSLLCCGIIWGLVLWSSREMLLNVL